MPASLYPTQPCWICGRGMRRRYARFSYQRMGDGVRSTMRTCDRCFGDMMTVARELRALHQEHEQPAAVAWSSQ